MRTLSKLGLSVATFALMMMVAPAALAAGGSVAVTVTGADGKPAANATVKVLPATAGPKKPAAKADLPGGVFLTADEKPKGKGQGPAAVKEGTTDATGKVTLTDIPAGMYRVAAMADGARGMAPVTIEEGKEAKAEITLKAGGGKKPAAK
ncbi:MAG TPA: carboxypeptidase-like regulatory domain-containing protein [Humisphaera sp.]